MAHPSTCGSLLRSPADQVSHHTGQMLRSAGDPLRAPLSAGVSGQSWPGRRTPRPAPHRWQSGAACGSSSELRQHMQISEQRAERKHTSEKWTPLTDSLCLTRVYSFFKVFCSVVTLIKFLKEVLVLVHQINFQDKEADFYLLYCIRWYFFITSWVLKGILYIYILYMYIYYIFSFWIYLWNFRNIPVNLLNFVTFSWIWIYKVYKKPFNKPTCPTC